MFCMIKYGTSRGRDTFGYNIVTLIDENGNKFKSCGGGYDMIGTVLADFINARFQKKLFKLRNRANYILKKTKHENKNGLMKKNPRKFLYGTTYNADKKIFTIDGGTGQSNVEAIAKIVGIKIQSFYDRSKRNASLYGFNIEEK